MSTPSLYKTVLAITAAEMIPHAPDAIPLIDSLRKSVLEEILYNQNIDQLRDILIKYQIQITDVFQQSEIALIRVSGLSSSKLKEPEKLLESYQTFLNPKKAVKNSETCPDTSNQLSLGCGDHHTPPHNHSPSIKWGRTQQNHSTVDFFIWLHYQQSPVVPPLARC